MPPIPETLQVHKLAGEIIKDNVLFIRFFKLSRDDTPAFTQYYQSKKDPQVCGHPDKDVDDNTYDHCFSEYKVNDEQEEWLCCRLCKKWFHESCFHKL